MTQFGKLERINDLRSVWKQETYDFATWISEGDNLELLSKEIGIDFEKAQKKDVMVTMFDIRTQ